MRAKDLKADSSYVNLGISTKSFCYLPNLLVSGSKLYLCYFIINIFQLVPVYAQSHEHAVCGLIMASNSCRKPVSLPPSVNLIVMLEHLSACMTHIHTRASILCMGLEQQQVQALGRKWWNGNKRFSIKKQKKQFVEISKWDWKKEVPLCLDVNSRDEISNLFCFLIPSCCPAPLASKHLFSRNEREIVCEGRIRDALTVFLNGVLWFQISSVFTFLLVYQHTKKNENKGKVREENQERGKSAGEKERKALTSDPFQHIRIRL